MPTVTAPAAVAVPGDGPASPGSPSRGRQTSKAATTVTVSVANTGTVAGAEVVQVYVRDVAASVARPVRELRGFTKVTLEPGESRRVTVTLDQRAFSFWSDLLGRWVVEAGEFAVEVGQHSRDLPLTGTVTIDAPSIAAPITSASGVRYFSGV